MSNETTGSASAQTPTPPTAAAAQTPRERFAQELPAWMQGQVGELKKKIEKLQKTLDDISSAEGSVRVELTPSVEGDADAATFHLNFAGGAVAVGDDAAHPVVAAMRQSTADHRGFRDAGLVDAVGLPGGRPLTRSATERLRQMGGGHLRLVLTRKDAQSLALESLLGPGQFREQPQLTITISLDDYKELIAGRLNPQVAFMSGRMRLTGDMGLAMKMASLGIGPGGGGRGP